MKTQEKSIVLLPDDIISQIAAGEVIENPSSVVKELVENSLDAGAKHIRIDVVRGGKRLIRISDDGYGMDKEQAPLSLQRHATSKLKEMRDFDTLQSMGFRGEALASIASVSKLTLISQKEGEKEAVKLFKVPGEPLQVMEASRTTGTTLEIEDLFFNVPVRQKFQKSEAQNLREIIKVLHQIAMAYYEISFELWSNHQKVFHYPLTKPMTPPFKKRIKEILGSEYFKNLHPVEVSLEGYSCQGYIGSPLVCRSSRQGQYLFINKRVMKSPLIAQRVKDAFSTQLPSQKFPIFVLFFDLPPSKIDVNVHPQKRELRFQEEEKIKTLVAKAVEKALQPVDSFFTSSSKLSMPPHSYSTPSSKASSSSSFPSFASSFPSTPKEEFSWREEVSELKKEHYRLLDNVESQNKEPIQKEFYLDKDLKLLSKIKHMALLEDPCALFIPEEDEAWLLVNLQALGMELFYRQYQEVDKMEIENLLIPVQLEVSAQEAIFLKENQSFFQSLGFSIEPFGEHTFVLQSFPSFLKKTPLKPLVMELMSELSYQREALVFDKLQEKIKLRALKPFIQSVKYWQEEDILRALKAYAPYKENLYCPRGKRIWCPLDPLERLKS